MAVLNCSTAETPAFPETFLVTGSGQQGVSEDFEAHCLRETEWLHKENRQDGSGAVPEPRAEVLSI